MEKKAGVILTLIKKTNKQKTLMYLQWKSKEHRYTLTHTDSK